MKTPRAREEVMQIFNKFMAIDNDLSILTCLGMMMEEILNIRDALQEGTNKD